MYSIDWLSFLCVLQAANLSLYLIAYVVFLILPASQPCDVQRQVMIIKTGILFLQSEVLTPTIYMHLQMVFDWLVVCLKDMFRVQEAPTTTLYIGLYVF